MTTLKRIVIAALAGLTGMLVLWAAAFFLVPKIAVAVYLYPGIALTPILGGIASKVLYFLFPSGGLDATAGLAALSAALFWWFLGALGVYVALCIRKRAVGKSG